VVFLIFLFSLMEDAGAIFLLISPGPAQVGMGKGGVAYYDNIASVYYNPASINLTNPGVFVQNTPIKSPWNVCFTEFGNNIINKVASKYYPSDNVPYSPNWLPGLYPGMRYIYGGIKFPELNEFNFGINYTFMNTGETSTSIVTPNDTNTLVYRTHDYAISATLGKSFYDEIISAGITLKYIHSFLAPEEVIEYIFGTEIDGGTASSFTFDIGLLLKDPINFLTFGTSYSNIVGSLKYIEGGTSDPLPAFIRAGISLSPVDLVSYALEKYYSFPYDLTDYFQVKYTREILRDRVGNEHETWHSSGFEFEFFNCVYLREGRFEDIEGGKIGKTRGFGLELGNIRLDYADDSDIYDFYTSNDQISLSIDIMEGNNKYYAYPLSLMFPGAGHMYKGDQMKGFIYGGGATLISMLDPMGNDNRKDIYNYSFYAIYIASIVDLIISNLME
jgi:hypothetical protein